MKENYGVVKNEVVKNTKKGFTLIELIAIILILAIIALIAIPAVTKLVEEARKQSFKVTATNVVDAADKDCNILLQKGESVAKSYTIADYAITNGYDLSITGKLPLQGSVAVNDTCDVAIAVNNNKWCASKNYSDDKVTLTDYVDGNCNYSSGGSTSGGDLLVDKIEEIRASELTNGVNLGTDEYDYAIAGYGTTIGYYDGRYFSGSNPNNYITVDGKPFRIIGLTNQGIAVVGDTGSYITDDGYGNITFDSDFKSRFNDLGLVRSSSYFFSTNDGYDNSFGNYDYDTSTYTGGTISYGEILTSNYALLSFYDYELTTNRLAYSSCLKSNAVGTNSYDTALDFVNCAQTSWLGNNIYLNIGFYFYGTGAISPGYLSAGKFNFVDSAGNGDNGVCTDCTKKLKLLVRNDSFYVSGTGTEADPFIYKTAYDASKFTQNDCFILDSTGSQITSFDYENSACLKDIVIPATINEKAITEIADSAFQNSGITSINFSNATNLVYIGAGAFANNVISGTLTLPANITEIGSGAFYGNGISGEIIIPSSVTNIGYDAFRANSIETLTFASGSNLSYISGQAFAENYSLVGTIDLPATITSMEDSVFCWSNISTLNIPNSVTGLSSGALNCTTSLTTINVDNVYNGLAYSPWGNSTATINWLRAATYNLTYDSSSMTLDNTCLAGGKYMDGCTITVSSAQAGYSVFSYDVNGVTYKSSTFVMPNQDTTISNIVLTQIYILESAHSYTNNLDQTYTVTVPGATKIKVTFNSSTRTQLLYDKICLTNSIGGIVGGSTYFSGYGLASQSFIVDGDQINIRLTTNSSTVYYGFYATVVKYE